MRQFTFMYYDPSLRAFLQFKVEGRTRYSVDIGNVQEGDRCLEAADVFHGDHAERLAELAEAVDQSLYDIVCNSARRDANSSLSIERGRIARYVVWGVDRELQATVALEFDPERNAQTVVLDKIRSLVSYIKHRFQNAS